MADPTQDTTSVSPSIEQKATDAISLALPTAASGVMVADEFGDLDTRNPGANGIDEFGNLDVSNPGADGIDEFGNLDVSNPGAPGIDDAGNLDVSNPGADGIDEFGPGEKYDAEVARQASGIAEAGGSTSEENYPQETDDLSKKTAGDTPVGTPPASATTPVAPANKASSNLLHNYSSFTYSLSLHVLSGDDYTNMMNKPGEFIPTNVLIASAGRRGANANMARNTIFNEDFFFDKLELETVIGLNAQAKNSNVINLSFTLIEPYGMTLLNRLLALGELPELNVKGNYVTLPYLLVIDFFGYSDEGIPEKISGITKYIPIRILTLGMKVTQKGAEYAITACPFNHQAFSETVATVPFKLEVAASTIADFFLASVKGEPRREADSKDNSGIKDYTNKTEDQRARIASMTAALREYQKDLADDTRDPSATAEVTQIRDAIKTIQENLVKETAATPTSAVVQSFTGAINAWKLQQVADKQAKYADEIFFEIEKDIAEGKFPDKENVELSSTKMTKSKDIQKDKNTDTGLGTANTISQMTIGQGTSILEVINLAIKNSTYIYNQVIDPAKIKITEDALKEKLNKPLDWFKVIPRVELGPYDDIRNEFSKRITYQIVKSTVINTKSEDAPLGGPKEYVKDYQYIFTGKNYDILNFDLKFDTLYWSAKTSNPSNQEIGRQAINETGSIAPSTDASTKVLEEAEVRNIMNKAFNGDLALRPRTVIVGQIPGQELGKGSTTESIKRLNQNILTNPSGDMISVDLKILGDPDFIKQDDYFYGPGDTSAIFAHKTPNNSIVTDTGEIFVNLAFNTPGDYDDTGLARPNSSGKYSVNSFSGLYRVLTVKSHFGQGKFEQNLTLIRHPSQPTQGSDSAANDVASADRPVDDANNLDTRNSGAAGIDDAGNLDISNPGAAGIDDAGNLDISNPGADGINDAGNLDVNNLGADGIDEFGNLDVNNPGADGIDEFGNLDSSNPGADGIDESGPGFDNAVQISESTPTE